MRRMILALSAAAFSLGSTPAFATGTIGCDGVDNPDASAFVLVGRVPFLAVLDARFSIGDALWSTYDSDTDATPIVFAQGIQDETMTRIEFSDEQATEIVVKLNLFRDFDDKTGAEAGVLSITGGGVFAVTCESG